MKRIAILTVVLIMTLAFPCWAADYYVNGSGGAYIDPSGNTWAAGSSGNDGLSMAHPKDTITHGIALMTSAPSTVHVADAVYAEKVQAPNSKNGSDESHRYTVQSEGWGNCIIRYSGAANILEQKGDYWNWIGFVFDGQSITGNQVCSIWDGGTHAKNNKFYVCLFINGAADQYAAQVYNGSATFYNCFIGDGGTVALACQNGSTTTMYNCLLAGTSSGAPGVTTPVGAGIETDSGCTTTCYNCWVLGTSERWTPGSSYGWKTTASGTTSYTAGNGNITTTSGSTIRSYGGAARRVTSGGVAPKGTIMISADDYETPYWKNWGTLAYNNGGVPLTFFMVPTSVYALHPTTYLDDINSLLGQGHAIEVHGWSHQDLDNYNSSPKHAISWTYSGGGTGLIDVVTVDAATNAYLTLHGASNTKIWIDPTNAPQFHGIAGTGITGLVAAINAVSGFTATKHANCNGNPVPLILADCTGKSATLDMDTTRLITYELGLAATWIHTTWPSWTPTTFTYPDYPSSPDGVAATLATSGTTGIVGGRSDQYNGAASPNNYGYLPYINIFRMADFSFTTWYYTDGNEAETRLKMRHLIEWTKATGAAACFWFHVSSDPNSQSWWPWVFDELSKAKGRGDINVTTFPQLVANIRADHTTSNNLLYTKAYTTSADYRPLPNGPLPIGGTAVAGLTKDLSGRPLPCNNAWPIGPYAYRGAVASW